MRALPISPPHQPGIASFFLGSRSLRSDLPAEVEIRRSLVERDLLDCVVALPLALYAPEEEPGCLWFLARDKRSSSGRDRRGEVLFIDAQALGGRPRRWSQELSEQHVMRIVELYRSWRGDMGVGRYRDVVRLCRRVATDTIASHGYRLDPAWYVGHPPAGGVEELDGEPALRVAGTLDLEALDLWQET